MIVSHNHGNLMAIEQFKLDFARYLQTLEIDDLRDMKQRMVWNAFPYDHQPDVYQAVNHQLALKRVAAKRKIGDL